MIRRDGITANDKPGWRAGVNQALGWQWQPYTAPLAAATTNPTGWTTAGGWYQVGSLIVVRFALTAGTGMTAGSGAYRIGLPVTAASGLTAGLGQMLLWDSSANASVLAEAYPADPTYATLGYPATWAGVLTTCGAAAPWAWASGDIIRGTLTYEAALPS